MAFVPLDALTTTTSAKAMRETLSKSGCTSSSCGSDAGASDLPPEVWARIKDHPCYSEEAHHFFARMHVAVAPACNIQCHYCNRKFDCANESRPGVVSERLSPEEALRKVVTVANEVPQLSVLGIAGPGDALFDWKRTKRTFELVSEVIPDIKLCVSTNGLALPDHVEELAAMKVDHVTITINMVDPAIGEKIHPWIYFQGRRYTGIEASRILHERQMLGLEMLTKRGILVKVNSVLIPGINDEHLPAVNAAVTKRGAFLHNIMPLISDAAHGTHFGLTGQRGPTHAELEAVQAKCGGGAKLMRHCRQCRADAVGLLGEDRGQQFTLDRIADTVTYDASKREAYRDVVAREREDREKAKAAAMQNLGNAAAAAELLVAVTTRGGGRINQHFGHAREFQLYRATPEGITFMGLRRLEDAYCKGGEGEANILESIIAALQGVDLVLVGKIGDAPKGKLEGAGLNVSDEYAHDYIETAISDYYARKFGAAPRALSA